jgi:drug/metabolite transporter (DMT)-like permease
VATEPTPPSRARGAAALALAGLLFGSTFLVVQGAVERASVAPFLAVRFLFGAAVLWPLARRRPATPGELGAGVLAGLTLLGGFLLQTTGLRSTTAATSAFITYLLVVLVPVMTTVRSRRLPSAHVVAGVVLAVAGLYLLAGGVRGLGRGELLTLGCAFFFALHIVVLGEVSARHDPLRLTMWQAVTVGVACLVPGALAPGGYCFDGGVWAAAAFCGVGATAAAFWCMAWAQRVVPEAQAAIILLLEPVSAGVLGELVGDHLGARRLAGATLILVAVVVAELLGRDVRPVVGAELALVDDAPMVDGPSGAGGADAVDGPVDGSGGTGQPAPP